MHKTSQRVIVLEQVRKKVPHAKQKLLTNC